MIRIAALGIAFVFALVGAPRSADACSCLYKAPYVTPADGATDVPLDVRPQVLLANANPFISVRLTDGANDVAVAVEQREPNRWFVVTPGRLAPDTRYSIVITDSTLEVETSSTFEFTTGTTFDTIAPEPARLTEWSPETMDYPINTCFSSCIDTQDGYVSRIGIGVADMPSDAVMVVLELETGVTRQLMPYEPGTIRDVIDPNNCSPEYFSLARNAETCGRLHVVDASGNASTSERVCSPTSVCAKRGMGTNDCEPSPECDPIDDEVSEPADGCATSSTTSGWGLAAVAVALGCMCRSRRRARKST